MAKKASRARYGGNDQSRKDTHDQTLSTVVEIPNEMQKKDKPSKPTRKVDKKFLYGCVHRGETLEILEEKYGITEEMVMSCLNRTANARTKKDLLNRFRRNRTQAKLPMRKTPANDSSPDTRESASTEEGFAIEGDSKISDALEERGAIVGGDPTSSSTTLEGLRRQKEATSQEIRIIEAAHKNIVSQRRQYAKELEGQQKILQELSQRIDEVVSNVERIHQEYTALGEEMQSLTANKKTKLAALQGIDEKISALSEVTIFVERSGSGFKISAEQMGKDYQLSDEGYNEIYKNLMESSNEESIQDLTLREIRALAILIAVTKNLADSRYNVIIDAAEIEKAFKACSLEK